MLLAWLTSFHGWTSRLAPAYGYGVQSFASGPLGGSLSYHRLFLRHDLTRTFGPRFALSTGIDGLLSYDIADYALPLPPEGRSLGGISAPLSTVRRRLYDSAPAVYVEGQFSTPTRLPIVPGVRLDYFHVVGTDKLSIDPRPTCGL